MMPHRLQRSQGAQREGDGAGRAGEPRIMVVGRSEPDVLHLTRLLASWNVGRVDASLEPADITGLCAETQPDLIVLDLDGSDPDVVAVLAVLRPWRAGRSPVPVLVLTHDVRIEIRRASLRAGATDVLIKPFDGEEAFLRIGQLLETRRMQEDLRRHADLVEQRVRERTVELDLARLELLQRLGRAGEYRDDVSGEHPERVGRCVRKLCEELGHPAETVSLLGHAAALHDIGNVAIPDAILLKPGALSESEAAIMRTHVEHGVALLAGSASPLLQAAQEIVATHHERWDGGGYPAGLQGDDIPLAGRIVPVADVFDALVHDRPHRPAWSLASAVAKIAELSGTQFDPLVVEAFLALDHEALLVPVERQVPDGVVPVLLPDPARALRFTKDAPAPSAEPAPAVTHTVGPAEAAAALGVSAGTIRRWADAGRIPCVRTAGGHRRFAVSEVRAAIGTGPAADRPAVSRVTPPSHPLPAVADVLIAEGPDLARLTAKALYDGLPGWWTTRPALDVADPWVQSVAGCLLSGTYGPAIAATRRLMDRAELAGTTRLERHRFLERFSDILIRRLARDQTLTPTEILSLRRLFAALRQTLLEDAPLTPRS